MRKCLIISVLILLSQALGAQGWKERIEFGTEWGYSATFVNKYHFNYFSSVFGSRIDTREIDYTYKSNGHLYFFGGYRFSKHFAALVKTGWIGVYEGRRVMPLTAGVEFLSNGHYSDGYKIFADGGTCIAKTMPGKHNIIGRAGFGRRFILDRNLAMDMSLSVQYVSDHPTDVYDYSRGVSVPFEILLRSDCQYASVNLSVGLCF